jgi:hypothetical protein
MAFAAIRADEILAPTPASAIIVLAYPESCTATARNHKHTRLVPVLCGGWLSRRAHRLKAFGLVGNAASDHGQEYLGVADSWRFHIEEVLRNHDKIGEFSHFQ